jgi:ParB family chromosome partitioning protein
MSKKDLKAAMQRTADLAARSSTAREGAFDQVLGAAPAMPAPAKLLPGARLVPIGQIKPDPNQPRKTMNKESLADLASSIREDGVLQPITVRWDASTRVYWIITGHRRVAAGRLAELTEIPALVQADDFNQQKTLQHQLVENIQREGIPPVEEARAVQMFLDSQGISGREAGRRLGKGPIYVSELQAILKIEPKLLDKAAHLPKRALVEIGRGKNPAEQERLLNAALTSKTPHAEVKRERDKARKPESPRSVHRFDVEDVGATVAVTFNRKAETVSAEDVLSALEKVVERLAKEGSGKLSQRGHRG